jgi:hypothetical protein
VNCGGLVSKPVPVFAVSFVLLWLQHSAAGLREGGVEWALYPGSSLLSMERFAVGISFVRSFLWWFGSLFRRFVSLVCLFRWFVSLAVWTGAQLLGDERPDE